MKHIYYRCSGGKILHGVLPSDVPKFPPHLLDRPTNKKGSWLSKIDWSEVFVAFILLMTFSNIIYGLLGMSLIKANMVCIPECFILGLLWSALWKN